MQSQILKLDFEVS